MQSDTLFGEGKERVVLKLFICFQTKVMNGYKD